MYNSLSRHRTIIRNVFLIVTVLISGLLFYFASEIFTEQNVYFYTSSTIVQGFMALVAFLGTVVVFKVQLEDQAMQKLSDGVEGFVQHYHGLKANVYTPTQMFDACKEIIERGGDYGNLDSIKKAKEKMEETLSSRSETRNKMVDFAVVSFFNISVAIISLLFTPVLKEHCYIGGILLTANVYLSIFTLSQALQVVRSTMGYSFQVNIASNA